MAEKEPALTLQPIELLCPQQDNITCSEGHWNLFLGSAPTYVSLVSSSISSIGAMAIILTYIMFKDLRTGSRTIITYLSIADLVTSLGYIVGGSNYLVSMRETEQCYRFDTICSIQSYITTWSQLSSYVWNCALAAYLFMTIVLGKNRLANRLTPSIHVIAWGLPILVALPLLCFGYLGYSPYSASNWCFIKDSSYRHGEWLTQDVILPIMIARICPEFLTYVFIIALYAVIKYYIFKVKRQLKDEKTTGYLDQALQRIDKKLLLIPLAFIFLRIWGFVQFFFILTASHYFGAGCVSFPVHVVHQILGILEAIGEGGQGWINAFLFIGLNAKSRYLLFHRLINILTCWRLKRRSVPLSYYITSSMTTDNIDDGSDVTIENTTINTNSTGLIDVGGENFHSSDD